MPQMAPTNWIFLMIYFILIFYLFNVMNYFIMIPKITSKKNWFFSKKLLNWKW